MNPSQEFQTLLLTFRDAVIKHRETQWLPSGDKPDTLEPETRIQMDNAEGALLRYAQDLLKGTNEAAIIDMRRLNWVEKALNHGFLELHAIVRGSKFHTHWHSEDLDRPLRTFLDLCRETTLPGDTK